MLYCQRPHAPGVGHRPHKKTTDKESGIINDATVDLEGKPLDIIALVERLVYVGVESDRLVSDLPDEFESKDWKPKKTGMDEFVPSSDSIQMGL